MVIGNAGNLMISKSFLTTWCGPAPSLPAPNLTKLLDSVVVVDLGVVN